MSKRLLSIIFSGLLLVPFGATNLAFAHQPATTPLICPPFSGTDASTGHSITATVFGSSVGLSYGIVNIPAVTGVRAVLTPSTGGTVLATEDRTSPFTGSFNNLPPGSYIVRACFMSLETTIHTSQTTFTILPPPSAVTCGPTTSPNAQNQCVPNLNQICGQGTIISGMQCIAQAMSSMVGGTLLEINTISLLLGAIGTNPVITTLVGITFAGVAGQAFWFIHRRKKSENLNS